VNFVSWAFQRAGWEGVNALLAHPPLSTEQILHPDKYFVRAEYPLTVQVGALGSYEQAGWQVAQDTTLGELMIRLLAKRYLSRDRATTVAAGWDGDRLIGLIKGDAVALVWLTAWDSQEEAAEFAEAYRGIVAGRHQGATASHTERHVVALTGPQPYYVEQRGAKVLAIEGPLENDLEDLAARIWRRSTYQPATPSVPLELAVTETAPR
jgi:hypothetical protein